MVCENELQSTLTLPGEKTTDQPAGSKTKQHRIGIMHKQGILQIMHIRVEVGKESLRRCVLLGQSLVLEWRTFNMATLHEGASDAADDVNDTLILRGHFLYTQTFGINCACYIHMHIL